MKWTGPKKVSSIDLEAQSITYPGKRGKKCTAALEYVRVSIENGTFAKQLQLANDELDASINEEIGSVGSANDSDRGAEEEDIVDEYPDIVPDPPEFVPDFNLKPICEMMLNLHNVLRMSPWKLEIVSKSSGLITIRFTKELLRDTIPALAPTLCSIMMESKKC